MTKRKRLLGCNSYCLASSTSVLSSRRAANATFALSPAECARLVLLGPVPKQFDRVESEFAREKP